ncbi:hypothetical protein Caci_2970 [Catenulispora acidiphila DSM 44928]|uniref:Uncharacterized protein n=1 Tax=Catenulispora acidiphila (strain DSM 44928 / JCM 14897 / NBRC 102108 / NRRL B-24433 / ID139908) TaxID=479433 RepID=C7Q2Y7_CATAD|nr:hypothetical protein [Catenulispora acidiphila]ACU71879.1 hypothetical protein Caci_2970 [Catenulispora acidiphila DSM 44928]
MNGPLAKIVAAVLVGAAALVIGVVLLVAATDPNARTCPPGKTLVIMPAGKVSVPECV